MHQDRPFVYLSYQQAWRTAFCAFVACFEPHSPIQSQSSCVAVTRDTQSRQQEATYSLNRALRIGRCSNRFDAFLDVVSLKLQRLSLVNKLSPHLPYLLGA